MAFGLNESAFCCIETRFFRTKIRLFPSESLFHCSKIRNLQLSIAQTFVREDRKPNQNFDCKICAYKKTIISQFVFFGFRNCKIGFRIRFCQIAKADFGMKNGKTKRKRLSDQSGISLYAYQRLVNFFHRPSRQSVRSAVPKTAIYCSCLVKQ